MNELAPIIKDLAIILSVAGLVTLLFQKIHQPVVLGYLVAGIIIGPYTPPFSLVSDTENIKVLAELGVIFLMFSLGLHFSFHKLSRVKFSASIIGIIEVVLMLFLGFIAGRLLGWSFNDCLFLGAAISISSTVFIIKVLEELNLTQQRFVELVFGVLIIEDLLAILLLTGLPIIVSNTYVPFASMLQMALKLISIIVSWFLIGYFLVPPLIRKVMHYASNETLMIVSIALCLLLVCIAEYFHYYPALGGFIMGSILAETPEINRIKTLTYPIRDIFAAVFFVSIGMLIDPKIIASYWEIILLITCLIIFGKMIALSLGSFLTGQNLSTSLSISFSLAQIGEFSFIIAGVGVSIGAISHILYPIIVSAFAITTFVTPYLIRSSELINTMGKKYFSYPNKFFCNGYSSWIKRMETTINYNPLYRQAITRFLINGIVVANIFTLGHKLLLPELKLFINQEWLIDALGWIIVMIISFPFIWAMLFTVQMQANKFSQKTMPFVLPILSILCTFVEIYALSIFYFKGWSIMVIILLPLIILFFLLSNLLEKSYYWIEKHFVSNIGNSERFSEAHLSRMTLWDTPPSRTILTENSPFIGKTLAECQLRQQFEINIIAIIRGEKIFLAPRGNQRLFSYDHLIMLGLDEKISQFQNSSQKITEDDDTNHSIENFFLNSILLKIGNPLIGNSIKSSKIREKTDGIAVGLERNNTKIMNPDSNTILMENDVLYIIANRNRLKSYLKNF